MPQYRPKTQNVIQEILEDHFHHFEEVYEEKYAEKYGSEHIIRIKEVVKRFLDCGDYSKGIARIQCNNGDCRYEYFRPFSCKTFHLCPACRQKRLLLFSERLCDEVLLKLPHRQFVFTLPKVLRACFKKDKTLFADMNDLIFTLITDYYNELSGKDLKSGAVISYQSAGDFLRFNSHFHCIILEGAVDKEMGQDSDTLKAGRPRQGNRFYHLPIKDTSKLKELFRRRVIKLFEGKKLISKNLAKKLLSWDHSGFSVDNSIMLYVYNEKVKTNLAQYIARASVSLKKITYVKAMGKVIYKTKYNKYFGENTKVFDAVDFIHHLTMHVPPKGVHLIRYYGLYASRTKGKRRRESRRARFDVVEQDSTKKQMKKAWARLIQKIYEVDPLVCPRCGSQMRVVAVIHDRIEVDRILQHLIKIGRGPPGYEKPHYDLPFAV